MAEYSLHGTTYDLEKPENKDWLVVLAWPPKLWGKLSKFYPSKFAPGKFNAELIQGFEPDNGDEGDKLNYALFHQKSVEAWASARTDATVKASPSKWITAQEKEWAKKYPKISGAQSAPPAGTASKPKKAPEASTTPASTIEIKKFTKSNAPSLAAYAKNVNGYAHKNKLYKGEYSPLLFMGEIKPKLPETVKKLGEKSKVELEKLYKKNFFEKTKAKKYYKKPEKVEELSPSLKVFETRKTKDRMLYLIGMPHITFAANKAATVMIQESPGDTSKVVAAQKNKADVKEVVKKESKSEEATAASTINQEKLSNPAEASTPVESNPNISTPADSTDKDTSTLKWVSV